MSEVGKYHTAVYDGDWLLYRGAFTGEKRTILVKNKHTGEEAELDNRTAMYGRRKAKDGGWLAKQNEENGTSWVVDDFEIMDVQTPEPLPHTLRTIKQMIEGVAKNLGVKNREIYIGEGKSFRADRATILEYKGGRSTIKPYHFEEAKKYLIEVHGAKVVTGIETDDMITMRGMEEGVVVVSPDKDCGGTPISAWYNPNKPEDGVVDCRGLGKLWIEEKINSKGKKERKVRGIGRKFLYLQVCSSDPTDSYYANAASEKEWGPISTYDKLVDCTTDAECLEKMVEIYKYLYPTPREVIGWRGDKVRVSWQYAINELWDLVRMRRHPEDFVTAEDVLRKFCLWEDD